MPDILLYLLKANAVLVLFYLAYFLVLRKLTFYHLNRFFLVFGIVFSTAYPLLDLTALFNRHEKLAAMQSYAVIIPAWAPGNVPVQANAFDYWLIPVALLWAGCACMAVRLSLQFVSLYRIHRASTPATYQGVGFRKASGISEAFSFWKTIYLNPAQHRSSELESILQHEQIHVNGLHTLDVLLAELSTVFYWFNPGIWLMKKAMKENLEFIADQHVVDAGVDKKEYQYLLLKVVGATQPQIANQFNFPSLKRRIIMMNKNQSPLMQAVRYAIIIPIVAAPTLLLSANSKMPETEALYSVQEQTKPISSIPDSVIYYIDGKEATGDASKKLDPKEIHSVNVYKGDSAKEIFGKKATHGVISIITEKNKDSRQVQEFNQKFSAPPKPGTPPPPPAPGQEQLPPPPPPIKRSTNDALSSVQHNNDDTHRNYYDFLEKNPTIKHFYWASEKFVVLTKAGEKEVYQLNDKKSLAAAEKKYGKIPSAHSATKSRPAYAETRFEDGKAIVTLKSGKEEVYSLDDKESIAEYESKYGTLPIPYIPKPSIMPKVLVANSNAGKVIHYMIFPDIIDMYDLSEISKQFLEHGFDLKFKGDYTSNALSSLDITLLSSTFHSTANKYFNIKELAKKNTIILIEANLESGKLKVESRLIRPQ